MSRNLFGQLNNLFGSNSSHSKSAGSSSWEYASQPRTRCIAKLLGLHQARSALAKQSDHSFSTSLLNQKQQEHSGPAASDVTLARSDLLHALHLCFTDAGSSAEVPNDVLWWGLVRDVVRQLLLLSQFEWQNALGARKVEQSTTQLAASSNSQQQSPQSGGRNFSSSSKKDALHLVGLAINVVRWAVADLVLGHLKDHKLDAADAPPLRNDHFDALVAQLAVLLSFVSCGVELSEPLVVSLLGASFALSDSNSHNILSCIIQGASSNNSSSATASGSGRSRGTSESQQTPHHTASQSTSQLYVAVQNISQQVHNFIIKPLRSYLTLKTANVVAGGALGESSQTQCCSNETLLSLESCVLLLADDESSAPSADFARLSQEIETANNGDEERGEFKQVQLLNSNACDLLSHDLHVLCSLLRLRVLQRHVRHEVCFGDTAVAVPIAMEAQLLAHQINTDSGTSAMLTLAKALMANGSSNDAVVVAAQLVQLARLRWSCSSRNVANAMQLAKALEVHAAALIEHQEWDKALLEVFQGIAHLSATERMLNVRGTSQMIFFVSEQLAAVRMRGHFLAHAWKCFLKLKHRVASTQYFYQHVSHLRSVIGSSSSAANFSLCDAYFDRAEMLVELQMDEEAISMFAAALEALTAHQQSAHAPNNWRFVEIERNMALSYTKMAEREGNRTAKRLTLHLATSMAYSSLSRANKLGLSLQIRKSTVAVAIGLFAVGQFRKAAVLLEPIVETRHQPSADLNDVLDCTDSTDYDALLLLAKCLSSTDPQRALETVAVFRAEIAAQIDQLKQRKSKAVVGLTAFKRRKFMAMVQKRLLQEVKENAEAAVVAGDAYFHLKQWDQALSEYSAAMGLFMQIEDHKEEAQTYGRLSRVYRALGQVNTATEYLRHMMSLAAEQRDEILRYEATILLTKLYLETDKAAEATQLYRTVTSLAHQFEDDEVERITTKNLITAQKSAGLFADLVITAQALEKMSSNNKNTVDRRFALEHAADALFHLGQYKKCLDMIDECEKIPDHGGQGIGNVTGAMHSTRAKALLAMRNGSAAIDVLEEWRTRATNAESWLEVAKACVHLGNAFSAQSPTDAKRAFFSALDACNRLEAQTDESRIAAFDAVKWIVHSYYLNEELICTAIAPEEGPSAGASADGMANDIEGSGKNSAAHQTPRSANPLDDDDDEEKAEYDGGDDDNKEDEEDEESFSFSMTRQATVDLVEDTETAICYPRPNHADTLLAGFVDSDRELWITYSPTTAIEVIEFFMRLLCGFYSRWAEKPLRSPRTTVEKVLSTFPNHTLVFYLEEFSSLTSSTFDVIIRPSSSRPSAASRAFISKTTTIAAPSRHPRRRQSATMIRSMTFSSTCGVSTTRYGNLFPRHWPIFRTKIT